MKESISLLRIKIKSIDGEIVTSYKEFKSFLNLKFQGFLNEIKKRFKPDSKYLFLPNLFTDDELNLRFEKEVSLYYELFGEDDNIAEIISVEELDLDVYNNSKIY